MINSKNLILFFMLVLINSCTSSKTYYSNNSRRRTITIENDTLIHFKESIGCFGNSGTLIIKKRDSLKKINIDDKQKQRMFRLGYDLQNSEITIGKDSLIIQQTGEIYYTEKFSKSKSNKSFQNFYIILNNKTKKITRFNFKRVLTNLNLENYEVIPIDEIEVKKKYGINKKHKIIKLVLK